jgi:hypothetical protein
MIKREKLVYSFFFIVTVAWASTVAFVYINSQDSLEQERVREMSDKAYTVYYDVDHLVTGFDQCYFDIQSDENQFAQGYISNATREALYYGTTEIYLPLDWLESYGHIVQVDLENLYYLYTEPTYEAYLNISNTVQYALDQIDFAISHPENDSYQLIGELRALSGKSF